MTNVVDVIRARERHFADFGWLQTYWLFSFAHYYDPHNIQFGALRVFNDDVVAPGTGFPAHPHREMEIVTVVLQGEITHADSMGNRAVIRAGDVQRMSAGTGLQHSEFNRADVPVHFYQIWIFADEAGLAPSYDQRSYDPSRWKNRLFPIASGQGLPDTVTFHTAATIYRAQLEGGREVLFDHAEDRRLFVYLTAGRLLVHDRVLEEKDQARADLVDPLRLVALRDTELILVDVPSCRGWGYDEKTLRGERH